tara:strand:+ start:291 stop:884 length:594 start_codon:yes stop_codon:yes gene_type:complete
MSATLNVKTFQDYLMDTEGSISIYESIRDRHGESEFLGSIWTQVKTKGMLSDKQIDGIRGTLKFLDKKLLLDTSREACKDNVPSGSFVGKLKERYDMTLKFKGVKQTRRGFYVQTFEDRAGNQLMSFSAASCVMFDDFATTLGKSSVELKEGDCFTCRGTINAHTVNDFNPEKKVKQTIINRVKYKNYLGRKSDVTD